MDETQLAIVASRLRIGFGVAAVAAPRIVVRAMSGTSSTADLAPLFARMFGARDIALGLGAVVALDRGAPVRGWLEGAALADTADGIAAVLARENLTPSALRATVGVAGTAAILGIFLARRLDPPPPAHPGHPEAAATGHPPLPSTDSDA
jgi:hypothetical protein